MIRSVNRIVVFNLDSLYSGVALHEFFERYKGRIVLIVASKRYGKKYGSFLKQFFRNFKKSGWDFVNYLSFHLIWYHAMAMIAAIIKKTVGAQPKVFRLPDLAKRYGIPLVYTNEPNSPDLIEMIQKAKPDLILSAYFDHVIRSDIIRIPTLGTINIHTALLPDFKGPFPSLWPMIKGAKSIGVTVHYINSEDLDAGPILKQKIAKIMPGESILSLDCRLFRIGIELAGDVVREIEEGTAKTVAQDSGEGNYFSFPSRKDLEHLRARGIALLTFREFLSQFF